MATEKHSIGYAAIVAEAEAAVSSVKDPELRRVAFDRILSTLLNSDQPLKKNRTSVRAKTRSGRSQRGAKRSTGGPKAYVEALADDGFIKKQRTIAEVKAELANRGHHVALTSLSGPMQGLTQQRKLRRQKIKAKDGGKSTYAYSNW